VRIGIHTWIAGSLQNAAIEAADPGANTFQIFSTSPRMWRASVPSPIQIKLLRAAREKFSPHAAGHSFELPHQSGVVLGRAAGEVLASK
jgi:endonuclease IV